LAGSPTWRSPAKAANGREDGRPLARAASDVALIDLRMPVLDGVGAIAEIRARGSLRLASSCSPPSTRTTTSRAPVSAGARGCLLKDAAAAGTARLHPQGQRRRNLHPGIGRREARRQP
jgi:DNA-binding NarL/FixJ family response regulator